MKLLSIINNLCTPAQVYLFLSLISIILYLVSMINFNDTIIEAEPEEEGIYNYTVGGLIINIVLTIFWIILLNYICKFKHGKKIAWLIVLLPFFFMGLMLIGLICAVSFITLQTKKAKLLQKELNIERQKQIPNEKPPEKPSFGSQNGREYISELLK